MPANPKPCSGHTFLITRPEHQAKNLYTQIKDLGGQGILFPTLIIQPFSSEQIIQSINHLPSIIDKIIFTSKNAVHFVMPHWKKITSHPAVFAVGPSTLKALANFEIIAKMPLMAQFNSEGLLNLRALQAVDNQQIVIFSGVGGRTLLADELVKRGAHVKKIAVYKRECPIFTGVFPPSENISLIISTSSESLKNLWKMVDRENQIWLSKQELLVVSEDMKMLALELGFQHMPLVANNASDEAILSAILAWCDKYTTSEKFPKNQII